MTESHFRIAFLGDLDSTDGKECRDGHGEDQRPVDLDGTSSELETVAQTSIEECEVRWAKNTDGYQKCLDCINCNALARYTRKQFYNLQWFM